MKHGQKVKDQYGNRGFVVDVRGNGILTTIDRGVWYHITKIFAA